MKNFLELALFATFVFASFSCAHSSDAPPTADSKIQKIQKSAEIKNLDSTYLTSASNPDLSIGFFIGKDNVNYPALQIKGHQSGAWIFPDILQSVFTFNRHTAVNDANGNIYILEYPNWILSSTQLKPMSQVLNFDAALVACTKPLRFKQSGFAGECYSPTAGWNFAYDIRAAAPAMCGNFLRLISTDKNGHYLNEIDPKSGKVVTKTLLHAIDGPICDSPTNTPPD